MIAGIGRKPLNILFLSRWLPYPADNGSKLRIYNTLKQLAAGHNVALVALRDAADPVNDATLRELGRLCTRVHILDHREFRPRSLSALLGLFSPEPRSIVDTFDSDVLDVVTQAQREHRADVVIASQLAMAPYALRLGGRIPLILEELELSVFRDRLDSGSLRHRLRAQLTWLKLRGYLRRVLPRFAACSVVSERERSNVQLMVPEYDRVHVLPNAVDVGHYADVFAPPQPNTAVFAGALTYAPNLEAMRFFVAEVLPILRAAVPDFRIRITGESAGIDLTGLAQPGVEFTGRLADVRPAIAESWLSVVPLRTGGGTRLKVLEAMALGVPVVATSKGAEGLSITPDKDILVADDASSFAHRVLELLRSSELRNRIGRGGRQLVETRYDWQVLRESLNELVSAA